jgi:hypothetical protein
MIKVPAATRLRGSDGKFSSASTISRSDAGELFGRLMTASGIAIGLS